VKGYNSLALFCRQAWHRRKTSPRSCLLSLFISLPRGHAVHCTRRTCAPFDFLLLLRWFWAGHARCLWPSARHHICLYPHLWRFTPFLCSLAASSDGGDDSYHLFCLLFLFTHYARRHGRATKTPRLHSATGKKRGREGRNWAAFGGKAKNRMFYR